MTKSALFIVYFILVMYICVRNSEGVPCYGGCRNGGAMLFPTSIFGYCRCVCGGTYAGPFCEYPIRYNVGNRNLINIKNVLRKLIQRRMDIKDRR